MEETERAPRPIAYPWSEDPADDVLRRTAFEALQVHLASTRALRAHLAHEATRADDPGWTQRRDELVERTGITAVAWREAKAALTVGRR